MCPQLTPPITATRPVTDILHGIAVCDPFRWLENQRAPRTRVWLKEQSAYTRAYLDPLPERPATRQRVAELLAVDTLSDPWKVTDRYFYLKRHAHREQPVIMMRQRDQDTVLVDPQETDATGATALGILAISADARWMAYSVRKSGRDSCSVEFLDIELRKTTKQGLPEGFCRGVAFATDRHCVYYCHQTAGSNGFRHAVYCRDLGDDRQHQEIFCGGDDPLLRFTLLASPSGKRLGYCKRYPVHPARLDFLVHDVASGAPTRLVLEQISGRFVPFLLEDRLVALTDWKAPNARVVSIDLDSPEPERWRDIVPESNSRIDQITLTRNAILLTTITDLATELRVFDFSGESLATISMPSPGTASLFPCRADTDAIFYRCSSFDRAPSIHSYHPGTRTQALWDRSPVPFIPSSMKIELVHYPSKDGLAIPLWLVSPAKRRPGPLPTVLTAYGGFANSSTPQFSATAAWLVEQGCLFAVAGLRGGSEFGESWHQAAKKEKRQTAVDDFLAAAEWLTSQGCSDPSRLAIAGGSNAGLLVAAAFTQKPELFRAVICLTPLLDMVRYPLFDSAYKWIGEYGSPLIEREFHALLHYSPYHAVKSGTGYPAVLIISGDADTRCNPMHARKMTARLQASTTSEHPILLDYSDARGHQPVQPLSRRIEALTDRLAFLSHELALGV